MGKIFWNGGTLLIVIRDEELIVGSTTLAPRGCQTYPEFSFEWLEDEFDTVATRTADRCV